MNCSPIQGLVFDSRSREGLRRIRQIDELSDALAASLGLGTFASIFVGSSAGEAIYNITATDWELLAEAMAAVPQIRRRLVQDEARYQILDHPGDPKQRRFWEGVLDGCVAP